MSLVVWLKSLLFRVLYWIFVNTPVGLYSHRASLAKPAHVQEKRLELAGCIVVSVAYADSNYAYLLLDVDSGHVAAVDVGHATRVAEAFHALSRSMPDRELSLRAVLTTHKHWDHSGGNADFAQLFPDAIFYGGQLERVPGVTRRLAGGSVISLGSLSITVTNAPCHTVGHVLYKVHRDGDDKLPALLFSGDTLFAAGCGRFFEGSASSMLRNLDAIARLPEDTLLFPGHEYFLADLRFCARVESDNEDVAAAIAAAESAAAKKQAASVGVRLADELRYNVFLRVRQPQVSEAVRRVSGKQPRSLADVLAALRAWKNKPEAFEARLL
eukprot:PLAT12848.1.p1 GENE.PLAT12848.1~~PLAT12848.1.p1  ORF type:complete len:327 (-),score=120.99 PLAT12848.1:80-1060(-)